MVSYFKHRTNLKVVFHLIDSRHGCVDEDERIMRLCAQMLTKERRSVEYVVVLTKTDKGGKKGAGSVKNEILENVRETMRECGVGSRPIIQTSSETKLGRDDIWRFLGMVPT